MSATRKRNQPAMLCRIGCVRYVRLLSLVVGGEVAQPSRATHTVVPRAIVSPLLHAGVYKSIPSYEY